MNRYDWEDALIDAQTAGLIPDGALLVALKLARAINWNPKDKRPAGLYWKNQDAFDHVGVSRATFYRHQKSLLETGFLTTKGRNLLPAIPEKSQIETEESQVETVESHIETPESQLDNPFSEDTFSEEVCSEEDEVTTTADAPVVDSSPLTIREEPSYMYKGQVFPNSREAEAARKRDEYLKWWNDDEG